MANEPPNAEMRKQQGFFLYSHFMFCPLLWPSQLETEPLRTQKGQDPRAQDIKTFLCTDCVLTITSLSQLSITRTNQSPAWELLIRGAHPQMHSLPGTTQATAALIQQRAPQSQSGSSCNSRDGAHQEIPFGSVSRHSPCNSTPTYHLYGDNCLTTRCTHCHLDLWPTTVMSCDQVEKSKGLFPCRFPST